MLGWINAHGLELLVTYWFVSSAISALPSPRENGNAVYNWAFTFSHVFAANLMRIPALRNLLGEIPSVQKK